MSLLDIENTPLTKEYLIEKCWSHDPTKIIFTGYFTYNVSDMIPGNETESAMIMFRIQITFFYNDGEEYPIIWVAPCIKCCSSHPLFDVRHQIRIPGESIELLNMVLRPDYIYSKFKSYIY